MLEFVAGFQKRRAEWEPVSAFLRFRSAGAVVAEKRFESRQLLLHARVAEVQPPVVPDLVLDGDDVRSPSFRLVTFIDNVGAGYVLRLVGMKNPDSQGISVRQFEISVRLPCPNRWQPFADGYRVSENQLVFCVGRGAQFFRSIDQALQFIIKLINASASCASLSLLKIQQLFEFVDVLLD